MSCLDKRQRRGPSKTCWAPPASVWLTDSSKLALWVAYWRKRSHIENTSFAQTMKALPVITQMTNVLNDKLTSWDNNQSWWRVVTYLLSQQTAYVSSPDNYQYSYKPFAKKVKNIHSYSFFYQTVTFTINTNLFISWKISQALITMFTNYH